MEGDLGNLPALRALCDEFGAMLVVDDSHGTGVMGETGRGTHEYWGMKGSEIDLFTGTHEEFIWIKWIDLIFTRMTPYKAVS